MALLMAPTEAFIPIVEQSRSTRSRRDEESQCAEPLMKQASTISKAGKRAMEQTCHEERLRGDFMSAGSSAFWQARMMPRRGTARPSYANWRNAVTNVTTAQPATPFFGGASRTGLGSTRPTPVGSRANSRQSSRFGTPMSDASRSTNHWGGAGGAPEPLHGTMSMPQFGRSAHFGPGTKQRYKGFEFGVDEDDDADSVATRLMEETRHFGGVPGADPKPSDRLYQSSLRTFRGPKTIFDQRTHNRFRGAMY